MFLFVLSCTPVAQEQSINKAVSEDRFIIDTTMGEIEIELYKEDAPITTDNFLRYVDEGFYDGSDGLGATVFHRVISDFMIQGGGYTTEFLAGGEEEGAQGYIEKQTHPPIVNEALLSGLSNLRGTLSMARVDSPDSATAQFFINVVDNVYLDPGEMTEAGYAVFGLVTSGMNVVDAISNVSVDSVDAPYTDVVVESIEKIAQE
ncbi:MAG: hypothetical protein CMK59_04340 [Proteobacteria bacterium]|nr:hypothetical protein [Pseudomonadota bacterium]